jgi:hypothetical protein
VYEIFVNMTVQHRRQQDEKRKIDAEYTGGNGTLLNWRELMEAKTGKSDFIVRMPTEPGGTVKSSSRSRQNILGITSGEIPEEQLIPPPGASRLLNAGSDCTSSEADAASKCSCGVKTTLNPVRRVRRFSPRCEL